jgi:hypothetical protein
VIAQHTITTTPKYNFPQPIIDAALPQRFIEQSLHSLKSVHNQTIQLNQQDIQQTNTSELQTHALQLKLQPIPLKPLAEEITVAAIDTSSMKIGETSTGIVIAIRGATVCKENKHYRYMRLGPFIFHVTEENKKEVYTMLQAAYFNTMHEHVHQGLLNLIQMPTRIANFLERWLQTNLAKTLGKSLILFDGSLTSGTPDTPTPLMKETLHTARERGNIVLAFSKMTTLRVNGHLITEMLPSYKPPYMLETIGLKPKPPIVLFGEVYVARLTHGNYAFRLDIDKEAPHQQRIEAVEKLLGNDSLSQSYPETLRLAHILCTFTANEVIAMQHFITRKYGLKILNRPDIHRLLFGPFGRGEGCS